jgi:hypothetical protein
VRALRKRSGSASRRRRVPRPGHLHAPARPNGTRSPPTFRRMLSSAPSLVRRSHTAFCSCTALVHEGSRLRARSASDSDILGTCELLWIGAPNQNGKVVWAVGRCPEIAGADGLNAIQTGVQSCAKRFSMHPRAPPHTHSPARHADAASEAIDPASQAAAAAPRAAETPRPESDYKTLV